LFARSNAEAAGVPLAAAAVPPAAAATRTLRFLARPPASTRHGSSELGGVVGPAVAVWEVIAQHFQTSDGSGRFEAGALWQRHKGNWGGEPPRPNNAADNWSPSAADYARKHMQSLAVMSHASGMLSHPSTLCTATSPHYRDWRNIILASEVERFGDRLGDGQRDGLGGAAGVTARATAGGARTDSRTEGAAQYSKDGGTTHASADDVGHQARACTPLLRLLPFHSDSQGWGATLHVWSKDCSHVCYTPYYHLPLWAHLDFTLREILSSPGSTDASEGLAAHCY